MKTYYKGNIKLLSKSDEQCFEIFEEHNYSMPLSNIFQNIFEKYYSREQVEKWEWYVGKETHVDAIKGSDDVELERATKVFNSFLSLTFPDNAISKEQIIFEVVKSENNSLYAKEVSTGLLFPIKNNNLCITNMKIRGTGLVSNIGICVDEMNAIESIITTYSPASIDDINRYHLGGPYIYELYNKNSFKKEVKIVKEEQTLENEMIVSNRILNLLSILYTIDKEKHETFLKKYNDILKNDNSVNLKADKLELLIKLENDIKCYIVFYKDEKDNYAFLGNEETYFMNSNNEKNSFLTCSQLDDMFNLYLDNQNKFTLEDQNKILNKFARLYFYSIMYLNESVFSNSIIASRIVLYSKYLFDNNKTNRYIEDENDIVGEIKKIKFVKNANNERKEKFILSRIFKK